MSNLRSGALVLLTVSASVLVGAIASAQVGRFRGPGELLHPNLVPMQGGGPGGLGLLADLTRWEFWWEINQDRYLYASRPGARPPRPAAKDIFGKILPALEGALQKSRHPGVESACLIALGKIARTRQRARLRRVISQRLESKAQSVRASAALALGIARMEDAVLDLEGLARNTNRGQKLTGRKKVTDRTRAFACYALGLIADRSQELYVKQRVSKSLILVFGAATSEPDVRGAAIRSLSLLNPSSARGAAGADVLLDEVLESLQPFGLEPEGGVRGMVNSHVITTSAALLGRGKTAAHARFKKSLAKLISQPRGNHITRAAVIALGQTASPAGAQAGDASYSRLLRTFYTAAKDLQAKNLALIAMGQIGGANNRAFLMEKLGNGNKTLERPWAALALGVMEHERLQRVDKAKVDANLGRLLVAQLRANRNPSTRSALAIALGLCRYNQASGVLLENLAKYRPQDQFAGCLAMGLGLIHHTGARDTIRDLVRTSARRPDLLRRAVVAAALLKDPKAGRVMASMLSDKETNLAKCAAVAMALGMLGDANTIAPLVELLGKPTASVLSRASAATALGALADPERPFHWKLADNLPYRAVVPSLVFRGGGVLEIL